MAAKPPGPPKPNPPKSSSPAGSAPTPNKGKTDGPKTKSDEPPKVTRTKIGDDAENNWREKHEALAQTMKTARANAAAHIKSGGKIEDMPPPPVDTSGYKQCPHCGRRFNEEAAERHIPACKDMLHNKPSKK